MFDENLSEFNLKKWVDGIVILSSIHLIPSLFNLKSLVISIALLLYSTENLKLSALTSKMIKLKNITNSNCFTYIHFKLNTLTSKLFYHNNSFAQLLHYLKSKIKSV